MNVVFTYPNADPGHKQVIEFLKKFKNKKDTLLLKMLELIYMLTYYVILYYYLEIHLAV